MKKILAMLLALVMAMSMLTVAVFAEPGDVETEPDEPGDIVVDDPVETPEDSNPTTGIALAVIPMVVAGAAVAFAKKR